jgi:hypothetical protein
MFDLSYCILKRLKRKLVGKGQAVLGWTAAGEHFLAMSFQYSFS